MRLWSSRLRISFDARRAGARLLVVQREWLARRLFAAGGRLDVRTQRSDVPDADLLFMYRLIRVAASGTSEHRVRKVYQEVFDLDWTTAQNILTLLLIEVGRVRRPLSSPEDLRVLADDAEFALMVDHLRGGP